MLLKYLNKDYDILFQWSNKAFYCSELLWKAYFETFKKAPGLLQTFKDMNLKAPAVKRLIYLRYKKTGRKLNLNEKIITPLSLFISTHLRNIN